MWQPGRFDGFFEHGLHAWDVAAGVFILKQAGGKVSDFNGGENWLFGGELIAASGNFFDEFYATVHKHLGQHTINSSSRFSFKRKFKVNS
jgi:myo-inositol-1(or 4)-monophosphatase